MNLPNAFAQTVHNFLLSNGIVDAKRISEILGGFDLSRPVYEQVIEPGDRILQFVRLPEFGRPFMATGNWFCLAGATMDALGIFSGGAGRTLTEFTVNRPVRGLEGTAGPLDRNWWWAGGGAGGATQIFLADRDLFALVPLGTDS